jgi:phage tail sheath protein FI
MPEYLSPGVYIEEISVGPKPIEGVSTSTAAFIGPTERGPEYAKLITSWLEFQRWFGGYLSTSYMPYAVQGFFDNGGQRCFVARVANAAATRATGQIGAHTAQAVGRGLWGGNILMKVEPPGKALPGEDRFKLTLMYYRDQPPGWPAPIDPTSSLPADLANRDRKSPDVLEVYDNIVADPGRANSFATLVNSSSHLIRVFLPEGTVPVRPSDTALTLLGSNGIGDDGGPIEVADFQGTVDPDPLINERPLVRPRGLKAINEVDEVSLIVVPDESQFDQIQTSVVQQCEALKDRFALMAFRQDANDPTMPPPSDTSYAAVYFPWIKVYDPSIRENKLIPPTGHIAGIVARTDIERGVHKAPANEVVRGAVELAYPVTKGMQDLFNPNGVNCIRDFRKDGRGIRLWGARTMTSDPEWKYINVRRLFLYLEESIDEATQWVVFEPNDEPLWARVRQSIETFLVRVWRNGALMGAVEEEAFFVKCDRNTMTQDDIDNGRLICLIGVAPVKPAEFVIFRFFQKTAEQPS